MARKSGRRHGYSGSEGNRPPRNVLLLRAAGVVLLLLAMLAAVNYLGDRMEPESVDVRGDLNGRFEPTLTLMHQGQTYTHQELDYITLLLIGVDKPVLSSSALRGGGQADFLLLLTIDRERKQVHTLQLDRDTVSDVMIYGAFGNPAGSRKTQISLAYAFGTDPQKACENTVQAVSDLLGGIPIDHYIALDMDGMAALNDALGGVTVTLTEDFSAQDPQMTAGREIRLTGKQAEIFLRSRMSVGDGSNAGRMDRQSAFLDAAEDLMLERMENDAGFIADLLLALEEHLVTSCPSGWLASQAYMALTYERTGLTRLKGEHSAGADGFAEFHPDADALTDYIVSTFCK